MEPCLHCHTTAQGCAGAPRRASNGLRCCGAWHAEMLRTLLDVAALLRLWQASLSPAEQRLGGGSSEHASRAWCPYRPGEGGAGNVMAGHAHAAPRCTRSAINPGARSLVTLLRRSGRNARRGYSGTYESCGPAARRQRRRTG